MKLTNNPEYIKDLEGDLPSRQVGAKWNIAYSAVNKHRRRLRKGEPVVKVQSTEFIEGESETHNPDGSSHYVRVSETPWGYEDYRNFIRSRGQDPDEVTFTWGWTSNPAGGFWNKLNNVRPKTGANAESIVSLEDLKPIISGWRPDETLPKVSGDEAFVVALSDWQLGKSVDGVGTEDTVVRLRKSLDETKKQIERLRQEGRPISTLLLANLGDHIENVAGSYDSQTYEVDLNLRDQIELAIELNMMWVKELAPMFESVIYTANPCNHAQLTRGKGRTNITDDADNATGLIAEMVRQLCGLSDHLSHVEVRVPRGEMITPVTVAGVNIATAHGHKISGAEETWLSKQSQWLTHQKKFIPEVWLVAHKHHLSVTDFGPYTRIQATTVDPGSKWFTDTTGGYSQQGTTIFTVSGSREGLWDDLRVV